MDKFLLQVDNIFCISHFMDRHQFFFPELSIVTDRH